MGICKACGREVQGRVRVDGVFVPHRHLPPEERGRAKRHPASKRWCAGGFARKALASTAPKSRSLLTLRGYVRKLFGADVQVHWDESSQTLTLSRGEPYMQIRGDRSVVIQAAFAAIERIEVLHKAGE